MYRAKTKNKGTRKLKVIDANSKKERICKDDEKNNKM